ALELFFIEAGFIRERSDDQGREIDRAQQTGAIGRKWLFAAIVRPQAIGVEGVEAGYWRVEALGVAVGGDALDCRDKASAIERPFIGLHKLPKPCALVMVGKTDAFSIKRDTFT